MSVKAGAKLRKSRTVNPDDVGHMAFFWDVTGTKEFRGFYPNGVELQILAGDDPEAQRNYLKENCVQGEVVNDSKYADMQVRRKESLLCHQKVVVSEPQPEVIQMFETLGRTGPSRKYSFNPHHFDDCDNCVTWTGRNLRQVLGARFEIPIPESGRLSEVFRWFVEARAVEDSQ